MKNQILVLHLRIFMCRLTVHYMYKIISLYFDISPLFFVVLQKPGIKAKLNSLFIQLRKNCSHPDLLEAAFGTTSLSLFQLVHVLICWFLFTLSSIFVFAGLYPPVDKLLEQCGKFQLLDRLLTSLLARKHKVYGFSSHCVFIFSWVIYMHLLPQVCLFFKKNIRCWL